MIWLQGGPGESSLIGMFLENGPLRISGGDKPQIGDDPQTWLPYADLVYVDFPFGTGFSIMQDGVKVEDLANHMVTFIIEFQRLYKEYGKSPIFLTGQGYGGKFVVEIAEAVLGYNKANPGLEINLGGSIIGNPMISPIQQYSQVGAIPTALGFVDFLNMEQMAALERNCFDVYAKEGSNVNSVAACVAVQDYVYNMMGIPATTDNIALPDLPDYVVERIGDIHTWMKANKAGIYKALNLPDSMPEWEHINSTVAEFMMPTLLKSDVLMVGDLLAKGHKMLMYSGLFSMSTGYFNQFMWMKNMMWKGLRDVVKNGRQLYKIVDPQDNDNLDPAGYFWASNNFNFILIRDGDTFSAASAAEATTRAVDDFITNGKLDCVDTVEGCSTA